MGIEERLAARSIEYPWSEYGGTLCRIWAGWLTPKGYGRISHKGKQQQAHRVSYIVHVGPIPEGLTIDHLCKQRSCIEPTHLEPVTSGVNSLRGEGWPAKQARKTHCLRGHAFEGDNLIVRPRGHRACRTCRDQRNRNRGLTA